jgi:hypothetical protein
MDIFIYCRDHANYIWNIVECGVKHHNPNYILAIFGSPCNLIFISNAIILKQFKKIILMNKVLEFGPWLKSTVYTMF